MAVMRRHPMRRVWMAAFVVTAGLLAASDVAAQSSKRADWPAVAGDVGGMKYSPAGEITPANVGQLTQGAGNVIGQAARLPFNIAGQGISATGQAIANLPGMPGVALVLTGLREGLPNKQIARSLGIAEATVKVHVKAILRKARVRNRTQAAIWASQQLGTQAGHSAAYCSSSLVEPTTGRITLCRRRAVQSANGEPVGVETR